MNFLAHLYLSGDHEQIMIGNFIGDFVKGKDVYNYPSPIKQGILLHREIDRFTDSHGTVKLSKKRLWGKFRHYAPVIVDVFYDHFLAKNWNQFSSRALKDFTTSFYSIAKAKEELIPERANQMLKYMSRDDWLFHYQSVEGINQALTGMSRRTQFVSHMEVASLELENHYEAFNQEFNAFFPELEAHSKQFLISLQ